MPPSTAGRDSRDVPTALVQLANLLTRNLAPALAQYQITPQQWGVLATVFHAPDDPSLAAVSREMMVSKQNMTGMIARLETLGLLRRAGDPADLRASMLQLTKKGRQLVSAVEPIYRQWSEELLASLTESERKTFTRAVFRLTEQLTGNDVR